MERTFAPFDEAVSSAAAATCDVAAEQTRVPLICRRASIGCAAAGTMNPNGDDVRREAPEVRKATLASVLAKASLNEHSEADGPTVFAMLCKMGIVSKRKTSSHRTGRSPDWLKSKNPASPACGAERKGIGAGDKAAMITGRPADDAQDCVISAPKWSLAAVSRRRNNCIRLLVRGSHPRFLTE